MDSTQVIDFLRKMPANPAIDKTIELVKINDLAADAHPIIMANLQSPEPSKLNTVKILKHIFNIGLKEAKDIVDVVWHYPIPKYIQTTENVKFTYNPALEMRFRDIEIQYTLVYDEIVW